MSPEESRKIIKKAGGPAGFARLLGVYEKAGSQQRVSNWTRRGIPMAVLVTHWDLIQGLRDSTPC